MAARRTRAGDIPTGVNLVLFASSCFTDFAEPGLGCGDKGLWPTYRSGSPVPLSAPDGEGLRNRMSGRPPPAPPRAPTAEENRKGNLTAELTF